MKMETGGRGEKCIKKNLKHVQDGSENVVMEECFETREGKLKKKIEWGRLVYICRKEISGARGVI